jgi:predicted PurR-regulated permease PerM
MSLVLAVAMVLSYAGGTLQLAPLLGAYGLLVGIPLASLAVRLYQLAEEMARA